MVENDLLHVDILDDEQFAQRREEVAASRPTCPEARLRIVIALPKARAFHSSPAEGIEERRLLALLAFLGRQERLNALPTLELQSREIYAFLVGQRRINNLICVDHHHASGGDCPRLFRYHVLIDASHHIKLLRLTIL